MRDREPEPQPDGFLDPPRRFPPTAVGVATPPPPRRHRRAQGELRLRQRVRSATKLLVSLGAGATLGSFLPLVASASIVAVLGASLVALRVRRRRRKPTVAERAHDKRAA